MEKDLREEEKIWAADMKATDGKANKHVTHNKHEQKINVVLNKEHNGIELYFSYKPLAADRALLKSAGYKWHYMKAAWYAVNTPEHAAIIKQLHGSITYPDGWTAPDPEPEQFYPPDLNITTPADIHDFVREWYMKTYPTDDLGADIDPELTFKGVIDHIEGENFYNTLGVGDSIIRERIFTELASILQVDYSFVYDAWLGKIA